ncbi:hypothetical protein KIN20_004473 [Parelaphostrongylus tenuis]|uniref:Uncharacterized protein n=1 Tax=Parelaphostrongylus tenuis TaxID=148309 RepID=A0AAD5QF60_PARTN|nr:hypothetical protein KIN20_004473 [Parelaphostrongylus tenuis]
MKNSSETRPLRDKEHRVKMTKSPFFVWIVGLATFVALVACLAFSIFFQRGLSGFSKQVNAFVSIGDFSSIFLQSIVYIVSGLIIAYLLFVYLASVQAFGGSFSCCGSPCTLFLSSFISQGFLILWALMLCFVSSVSLVYFIFIGGIYSFCALVNQQCFDFRVLIPAVVKAFSNKKVDMTFCAEKKELLCSQENNQIWNLLAAFLCCFLTFGGLVKGRQTSEKGQRSDLK